MRTESEYRTKRQCIGQRIRGCKSDVDASWDAVELVALRLQRVLADVGSQPCGWTERALLARECRLVYPEPTCGRLALA